MKFCILISAFCLLPSVGLGQDVGVDTILVPSGAVDSGQSIIPCVVISNLSNEPADNVSAFFTIDDGQPSPYSDSIVGLNMPALTTETLAFEGWIPRGRDSMTAIAWVHCPGDTNPQNDTFRQRFLVRVKDIGITQIIMPPPDTILDPGLFFYPQCRAWNLGDVTTTFDVQFTIGEYHSTARGITLLAGGARVVTAPDPCTTQAGIWACTVIAPVAGDLHPENNIALDTFTVRGTISEDVDARAVLAPTGVVDTTETITPSGRVGNNGDDTATFRAYFIIRNLSGTAVYTESTQVQLSPGDSADIDYPTIKFSVLGYYTAACSVYMEGDQNSTNDVKKVTFRVVDLVQGDIGIVCVEMPHDTVDTFTTFYPWVRVKNYGAEGVSGFIVVVFSDTARDRIVYRDSVFFRLEGGEESHFVFDSVRFTVVGNHEGQFWLGTHNHADTTEWPFWVVPFVPGVEETMNDERGMPSVATVLRGVLWLPEARVEKRESRSELLDVEGRHVVALRPGANDVSGFSPGVYFVRTVGLEPSATSCQKVVFTR